MVKIFLFLFLYDRTLSFCQEHLSTVLSSELLDLSAFVETRTALLACLPASSVGGGSGDGNDGSGGGDIPQSLCGRRIDLWTDLFQALFLQHLEVSRQWDASMSCNKVNLGTLERVRVCHLINKNESDVCFLQVLLKSTLNELFVDFESALLTLVKLLDQVESQDDKVAGGEMLLEQDLASFVWSQNSVNTTETSLNLNQLEQPPQKASPLDESVDQLDCTPHNLVMVYFACLVGRRDLLPPPRMSTAAAEQLPSSLRCRLSRLLESSAATYAAFNGPGAKGETVNFSRYELHLKRRLVTPRLKRYS